MSDQQLADVHRVESVDVLLRKDVIDNRVGIDLLRQRHLHEDAMYGIVGVEPLDEREELGLGGRRRQPDRLPRHAGLARRLLLAADVDRARRIVADQHHGEAGHDTPLAQRGDVGGDFRPNLLRQKRAVHQSGALRRNRVRRLPCHCAIGQSPPPASLGSARP